MRDMPSPTCYQIFFIAEGILAKAQRLGDRFLMSTEKAAVGRKLKFLINISVVITLQGAEFSIFKHSLLNEAVPDHKKFTLRKIK